MHSNPQVQSFDPRPASEAPVGLPHGFNSAAANAATTDEATYDSATIDTQLVQQTKQQIRNLVSEIHQLAQSDISLDDFYDGFLNRVVSALASVGGAIWTVDERGDLQLQYQINLRQARLAEREDRQTRHSLLLKKIVASAEPALVPPQSGSADDGDAGNPTDFLLVVGVLKIDQQVQGIVEILQRGGGGPTTHRGYLRFLVQMCDLASDFLKNRRLRHYQDRQSLWEQLESFIRTVHRSLDPRDTVFAIANEGRRLIQCDRVSVALCRGRRCSVVSVSGLDAIDRRAAEVKHLGSLATAVVTARQSLWYSGDAGELPPQIERALQQYVDTSHTKSLAIVPLLQSFDEEQAAGRGTSEILGALVVEQMQDRSFDDVMRQRVEVVVNHSSDALAHALEHHRLFLLPLWQALGKAKWVAQARNLPKVLLAIAVILLAGMALCTPGDFDLAADGTLQPKLRREIFAGTDGILVDVPVDHAQTVQAGQILARLENKDLEVEIIGLLGQKTTTHERILSVQRALLDNPRLDPDQENRLSGELAQLRETADSLERQIALYREKEKQLVITSPQTGQVITWQVRDLLLHRPVQRGQSLMTVVDPSGDWELELTMPERRMGHITQAERASDENLPVTFILATHPQTQFQGRVFEIHRTAEVRGEQGSTVLIRVAIDKNQLPDLRDGSKVTARIHCGRRAIGYVLFHDVIETVHSKLLFWF